MFITSYRPQTKIAKVMFLHVSVILFTGGGYPSMPCRWYPSMPCRSSGGRIPACLAGFQAHTQEGAWGVWPGGGLQAHTQGEVEGPGLGGLQAHTHGGSWGSDLGVSRPTPRGGSWGSGLGGLQAHTQGGLQACTKADPPSWWLLLWVVHILLECILVKAAFIRRELLRERFSPLNHETSVHNPLLNFSVDAKVD